MMGAGGSLMPNWKQNGILPWRSAQAPALGNKKGRNALSALQPTLCRGYLAYFSGRWYPLRDVLLHPRKKRGVALNLHCIKVSGRVAPSPGRQGATPPKPALRARCHRCSGGLSADTFHTGKTLLCRKKPPKASLLAPEMPNTRCTAISSPPPAPCAAILLHLAQYTNVSHCQNRGFPL